MPRTGAAADSDAEEIAPPLERTAGTIPLPLPAIGTGRLVLRFDNNDFWRLTFDGPRNWDLNKRPPFWTRGDIVRLAEQRILHAQLAKYF